MDTSTILKARKYPAVTAFEQKVTEMRSKHGVSRTAGGNTVMTKLNKGEASVRKASLT